MLSCTSDDEVVLVDEVGDDEVELVDEVGDDDSQSDLEWDDPPMNSIEAQFSDALEEIVRKGGWGWLKGSCVCQLQVPVPEHLLCVLDPAAAAAAGGGGGGGGSRRIDFDLSIEWGRVWVSVTRPSECLQAGGLCKDGVDLVSYAFAKPLVMSIHNDIQLMEIFNREKPGQTGFGLPSASPEARRCAESRVSCNSELYKGVFALDEDRDKGILASNIVDAAKHILEGCKGDNLIVNVFNIIQSNLAHFSERCYVCGVGHYPPNTSMMPFPCCNHLCRFTASSKACGFLYSFLKHQPETINLILTLAKEAALSKRAKSVLEPAPPGMTVETVGMLFRCFEASKEVEAVKCETDLRNSMNRKDPRLYEMLWWLVSSLPNHIAQVNASEVEPLIRCLTNANLVPLASSIIFKIGCHSTSMDRKFVSEKRIRGIDRHAYHGSRKENWYSILKHGCRDMTGSQEHHLNGASYGSGVYLGLDYALSLKYGIVGICEVLVAGRNHISKHPNLWVVQTPNMCRVKYLLMPKSEMLDFKYKAV